MKIKLALGVVATLTIAATSMAAEPSPTVAQVHASPLSGFQGEWASRFCSKNHFWVVEGATVKMLKRDPAAPAGDYHNRHAEGATIMILGTVFDVSDRGIRLNMQSIDPNTGRATKTLTALTLYWSDPDTKKLPYYGFNDMIRPDKKLKLCK